MKYFKTHIILIIIVLGSIKLMSQNPKVDQARVNFIAQKLQLSPTESQKFWPIYNEYIDKIKSIRREKKKMFVSNNYSTNPADAEEFVKKFIQLDNTENQIKQEYIQKFKQSIGITKTSHLLKAEEEFRLELIKILKSD